LERGTGKTRGAYALAAEIESVLSYERDDGKTLTFGSRADVYKYKSNRKLDQSAVEEPMERRGTGGAKSDEKDVSLQAVVVPLTRGGSAKGITGSEEEVAPVEGVSRGVSVSGEDEAGDESTVGSEVERPVAGALTAGGGPSTTTGIEGTVGGSTSTQTWLATRASSPLLG
jgi:hypothetical protein